LPSLIWGSKRKGIGECGKGEYAKGNVCENKVKGMVGVAEEGSRCENIDKE
jgi:hypothetical protein